MKSASGNRPFPSYICALVPKRVFAQNLPYENEFNLRENESLHGIYLLLFKLCICRYIYFMLAFIYS